MKQLEGRVALVTGGGGSIGRAVSLKLAGEGASVAVVDINAKAAGETAEAVEQAGAEALTLSVDLCDRGRIAGMVEEINARFGRVDILINIAGGSARKDISKFHAAADAVIDRIIDLNLKAPLFCTRAVLAGMMERRFGKIVNIGSITGVQGLENVVDYSAAKGGVIAFTKALAKEAGEYGINVNCVSPGLVPRPDEDPARAMRGNYLGRICRPEDIAELTVFLCTEAAGFITGQNYIIDGGRSLGMKGS